MRTKNCVFCGEKNANITSGHVLREGKKVTASFCTHNCSDDAFKKVYGGCLGDWKEEYGLRK